MQAPTDPSGPLRRRPVQQRSRERFDRILDACARLLDEVGYTALTTKEVARRAEVPIGTLYQFFPGVDGLLGALAERNLGHFADRLAHRVEAERPRHIGAMVDLAIEEYVVMRRTVPGFGVVDFGAIGREDPRSVHLLDAALENNAAVADRLWFLVGGLLGDGDQAATRVRLHVALESADAVLRLAFRRDPEGDPVLIAECKRLLRGYLGD
ncbi:TetR/AcrR family transcriptional regulator [Actinacidiphila glaucinigra]|uniref:TetR/AcrR family transcriptional regulator n=1 Tax=Actinacidiphila glaucinigra TaxID=235986 RepID=UPI0037B88A81